MKKALIGLGIVGVIGIIAYKHRKVLKRIWIAGRRGLKLGIDCGIDCGISKGESPRVEHEFRLHAVGVTFNGCQERIRYTNKNAKLQFTKFPVKEDPNAVAIVDEHYKTLGWVPMALTLCIRGMMSRGLVIKSWKKVGGYGGYNLGLVLTCVMSQSSSGDKIIENDE